jgi:hypothetical protein
MKVSTKLLLFSIFTVAVYTFVSYPKEDGYNKKTVLERLKKEATVFVLNQKISKALDDDKIENAIMYKNIAELIDIKINSALLNKIYGENTLFKNTSRSVGNGIKGFVTGEMDGVSGTLGVITSDFTSFGDFRDFIIQTNHFVNNEETDKIVYALSAIGAVTSVATFTSLGAISGVDVGVSIIKNAKKSQKLSPKFINLIGNRLDEVIDISKIKNVDSLNPIRIKEVLISSVKKDKFVKLSDELSDIKKITKNTGVVDATDVMKYADSFEDVKKLSRLSSDFGKNTKAILEILGQGALNFTQFTLVHIFSLIISIISGITFICSLFFANFFRKYILN